MSHVALCSSTWKIAALRLCQVGHRYSNECRMKTLKVGLKPVSLLAPRQINWQEDQRQQRHPAVKKNPCETEYMMEKARGVTHMKGELEKIGRKRQMLKK